MRHLLPTTLLALLAFAGCTEEKETEADQSAWAEAVAMQNSGRFDEAVDRYRRLVRSTSSERLASKAELEIGRIEVALVQRDVALRRLGALPAQVDLRQLDAVESDIDIIVRDFEGTSFAEVVADRAQASRLDARRRHAERRKIERATIDELLVRGEFTAALDLLRSIESKRTLHDRRDVAELLVEVRAKSDAAADALLADFEERTARDATAAVAWIDEHMIPFRGTRAFAGLLAARIAIAPLPKPGKAGAEKKPPTDG